MGLVRLEKITVEDLQRIRARLGASVPEAAKKLGVDRVTWWRWEEAGVPFPAKYAKALWEMLKEEGVEPREVLESMAGDEAPEIAKGQPMAMVQVPLYSPHAAAGAGYEIKDESLAGHIGLEVGYIRNVLQAQPEGLYALVVDGDSMEPDIRSGEIALVAGSQNGATRDGIHILRLEGSLLCKRLGRLPGKKLSINSSNTAYPSFEVSLEDSNLDLSILGRVVGVLRRT
ncbi:MAG TPA: S24 family peptidase [Holophaga sp.]|nr:S24 family peptidase [Holophaga sp.]